MKWQVTIGLLLVSLVACTSTQRYTGTLDPPRGAQPRASSAMMKGNVFFESGQWIEAKTQFEAALEAQPSLAEAHYNLALTLDHLGQPNRANKHYLEAANLAPGNKVIWNSRPLRRHGDVTPSSSGGGSGPTANPLGGGF